MWKHCQNGPEKALGKIPANCARWAEVILGLVFIVGAVLKAIEFGDNTGINLFMRQISYYGVLPEQFWVFAVAALSTLAVEAALGSALLLGWRLRGLTLLAVLPLLVFFTCLIVYGWVFHGLDDCGCFGPIEMSPGVSVAKNGVLLLVWFVAWAGHDNVARTSGVPRKWRRTLANSVVCLACTVGLPLYASTDLREPDASSEHGLFSRFTVDVDGQQWDLGKGEYFVAVFNATCEDCMDSVVALNERVGVPGFPKIVALCWGDEEGIEEFRLFAQPEFPVHPIDEDTFWELIRLFPPRFYHIQDGTSLEAWDLELPAVEEVG